MTTKRILWPTLAAASLFIAAPQPAKALSLACCTSLDEMEQSSDLIVRGRAIADFDEVATLHLSEAEYQARIAAGEPLPLGASVIIRDDDWQLVEQLTLIPVEVLEVIEGETTKDVISVVQHNDWGAIPMKKDAEYLLFLQHPMQSGPTHDFYFNFYGQGTYNLDGTDPRTGSAGYYDAEAVEERYGNRAEFVPPLAARDANADQLATEEPRVTWFDRWLKSLQKWFKAR